MKILIIADNDADAHQLTDFVKLIGHEFEQAENVGEAIRKIREECFEVVICTEKVHYMRGVDACAAIKNKWPHIKTIIIASQEKKMNSKEKKFVNGVIQRPLCRENIAQAFS
jgi:DNA-binding NtrC family response regulator